MFKSKNKSLFAALTLAVLTLSACSAPALPVDINVHGIVSSVDKASGETTPPAAAEKTEALEDETTAGTASLMQPQPEEQSPPEPTESFGIGTGARTETADTEIAVESLLKWKETAAGGTMYINTEGVFSRAEALRDSEKVKRYGLNDKVEIIARTDTGYCKLVSGDYIHSYYLSAGKTETAYPAVTSETAAADETDGEAAAEETAALAVTTVTAAADVPASTAPPITTAAETTAAKTAPAETSAVPAVSEEEEPLPAEEGKYGQRGYTQTELDFISRVFELTNEERAKEGLPPFQKMDVLDAVASVRAWELTVEYRSDHTRPDGSSCMSAFAENGLVYGGWGENIAAGQTAPEAVVEAWMNSPSHRAAVLSLDYTYMGVGCYIIKDDYQGYYYFWTQEFYFYC